MPEPLTTAREIMMSGECTPNCILALVPQGGCECRCSGRYHGALADSEIALVPSAPVAHGRNPRIRELVESTIEGMAPGQKSELIAAHGWRRVTGGYIRGKSEIHTLERAAVISLREQFESDVAFHRRLSW